MDLFDKKYIKPMLIGIEKDANNDTEYINELKLDGIRCIAYLDKNGVDLRNKKNDRLLFRYPELSNINNQIKCERLILDGELVVFKDNKTDFYEMQKRSLMSNKFKIELEAKKNPISFVAFDVLYKDGQQLTDLELIQRKEILDASIQENERFSISRFLEGNGASLYKLAEDNGLEGIVSKKKSSKYFFDKRTKEWIKIKCYEDKDFVIMGYNPDSILLGGFNIDRNLEYVGKVALGISKYDWNLIKNINVIKKEEDHVWIEPLLVCTVKYMKNSKGLRQAVFKGIREDKCVNELIYR